MVKSQDLTIIFAHCTMVQIVIIPLATFRNSLPLNYSLMTFYVTTSFTFNIQYSSGLQVIDTLADFKPKHAFSMDSLLIGGDLPSLKIAISSFTVLQNNSLSPIYSYKLN